MLLTEYDEAEAMELFREEGIATGREINLLDNLRALMRSLGCTAERAMELLEVPDAERPRFLARLREGDR